MMNRETVRILSHNAAEIKDESIRYKTWPHPHLAAAEKSAKAQMIASADANLDWTGWRNQLMAIRHEQARRATWTV